MAARTSPNSMEGRVGALESSVSSLGREIHEVRSEMRAGFESLGTALRNQSTTNWSAIIGAGGLVASITVAILGFVWVLISQDRNGIQRNTDDISDISIELRDDFIQRDRRIWSGWEKNENRLDEHAERIRALEAEFELLMRAGS